MSAVEDWLDDRDPQPPPDLRSSLRVADGQGPLDVALGAAARARLDQARARPGRVRESAFRLLEADALFTYACEAALETEDPEAALRRVLAAAGR